MRKWWRACPKIITVYFYKKSYSSSFKAVVVVYKDPTVWPPRFSRFYTFRVGSNKTTKWLLLSLIRLTNYNILFYDVGEIRHAFSRSFPRYFTCFLWWGCGRRNLILVSLYLGLQISKSFSPATLCCSFPAAAHCCCCSTSCWCRPFPTLCASLVLAIICFLSWQRLNERNCQLFLGIWFLYYLFRFLPG